MKAGLIFLTLLAVVSADKYSSSYDDVDVDRILASERVLTNYIKCLMGEGSCTAEGRELKKTLPDALSSGCGKCNEKQRSVAERVIEHLKNKRVRDWDRLTAKYDPEGQYKKRYESTLNAAKKA